MKISLRGSPCHACVVIHTEYFILQIKPVEGVSAFPSGDNLFHWTATIVGGKDTVSTV